METPPNQTAPLISTGRDVHPVQDAHRTWMHVFESEESALGYVEWYNATFQPRAAGARAQYRGPKRVAGFKVPK